MEKRLFIKPTLYFNLSAFTNQAHQLCEAGALYASAEFLEHKDLKDGDMVHITNQEGDKLVIAIKLDRIRQDSFPIFQHLILKSM